jgi:hypothetical protein
MIGRTCISVLAILMAQAASAGTTNHRLDCPAYAPPEWGGPKAPLSEVHILASPMGQAIDNKSPPSLAPDRESFRAGVLLQSWSMNTDGPAWVYFVDCLYEGTDRLLRLDAKDVKICRLSISHFRATKGKSRDSRIQLICE